MCTLRIDILPVNPFNNTYLKKVLANSVDSDEMAHTLV